MTSPEIFSEPPSPRKVRKSGPPAFLSGGGEMGERMRAVDWDKTPLGPVTEWPQSLRTAVSMMLPSKAQIILFWGPEFVSIYNDAYIPVFGAKHPKMLGQPGRVAWSEIWEHQLHQLLEGVVRTGEAFHGRDLEFVLERHGFVEETYFDVSYDPVRDESGNVGGVYCIVTETTGRVVGERRLALLKDLATTNATARNAREACRVAIETMKGRTPTPFALAYLDDQLVAATPDAEDKLLAATSDQVRVHPIPGGKLVLGLNTRRPFDEHYQSFIDLVVGQVSTAINNAVAYEEERKRAEALAEVDRAKTAFFSNVSHEFRTPLTLMLGPIAELLANPDRGHSDRVALELVERNAVRLQKLVNTLLDFSRIEAGRVHARFVRVDLGALTADLASTFRSTIERAGLALRVECDSPDRPAFVDREMWEKIVLNLLSNAYKHTFQGEVTVRLRSHGSLAMLSVTDTGVGIPGSEIGRVFDRFHRVHTSRSRTHEGSGIGLSLVRELVRLHGGTVSVTSVEGQGTTFTVEIPLGSAHLPREQTPDAHAEVTSAVRSDSASVVSFISEAKSWDAEPVELVVEPATVSDTAVLAGAEILVADDNADMRNYIARLLGDAGARVVFAADGQVALQRLRERAPALVVCDVMMPRLDGFAVLAEMRGDDALKTIPFVMLSARAGEESRVSGLAAGADDYLVKPFVAKELIARVASQLRLARVSAAERRARADADEARREMSRVFEQAPIPICVVEGEDFLYTSANAYYRQIIGNRDPVGKTLLELWPNLDGSAIHNVFKQVLATGKAVSAEEFLVQFDQFGRGETRDAYFNFVYHPLMDTVGKPRGIIAVAVDVTAQVLARRAAEAANETKLQFLRTVSHETRQPVHASLGYLDLLMLGIRGDLTEAQLGDLENIRRNQTHLLRLLNDILSFAKLEAGALELDVESSDASEIIEVLAPLVEQQFRAKGVQYIARPPRGPAKFRGDRERTVQVCINLLTNALKATPAGGTVTIACDVADRTVSLSVSDTGVGIPAAKLEEIFDPFTQLARAKVSRSEVTGFGLGLSISRQLARAMKGDVTVESTVGVGSTFTFTLPRA